MFDDNRFIKKYFIALFYMSKKQTNIFFMEIFNNILKINDTNVMIVYDIEGIVWFGLRDIIIALGYKNIENAITKIKIKMDNKKSYDKIQPPTGEGGSKSIKPHKKFINESGYMNYYQFKQKQ